MLVANDISIDSRVKKTAQSAVEMGYRVTLIGLSQQHREEGRLGSARLIRVANEKVFAHAVKGPATPWVRLIGFASREDFIRARHEVRLRERALEVAPYFDHATGARARAGRAVRDAQRAALAGRRRLIDYRYKIQSSASKRPATTAASKAKVLRAQQSDWEFTFGVELDRLEPDLIHAHDIHLLGVAARAKARAELAGRTVRLIYDAHEYVRGQTYAAQDFLDVFLEVEHTYIPAADAVVTVSPLIAEWLARDYGVPAEDITVVLNAPPFRWADQRGAGLSVREAAGVSDETPLVVYSGGQSEARGVSDLVEAMAFLDDVHLVLVASPTNRYVHEQQRAAVERGYGHRVHVAPFVPPESVVDYLSSADLGVIPFRRKILNHDAALPNKLFEYVHAGLPVVASDIPLVAQLVTERGIGRVFEAEDVSGLAGAIRSVLAARDRHRAAVTKELAAEFSWESQAANLRAVYERLLPIQPQAEEEPAGAGSVSAPQGRARDPLSSLEPEGEAQVTRRELLIGPMNMAGQAHAWAEALRHRSGVRAVSMQLDRGHELRFPADLNVSLTTWESRSWQVRQLMELPVKFTHVLMEAGYGLLGTLNGGTVGGDLPFFTANGPMPGVVLHGSEIRDPQRHAQIERFSPFNDPFDRLTAAIQAKVDQVVRDLADFEGQIFVTTVDLLDYVDDAVWLPTCLDPSTWEQTVAPRFEGPPVVLHAPSRSAVKGSGFVDPVLRRLASEGLITYDRASGLSRSEMRRRIAAADVVLDQFVLGHYGHTSVEALAAGRVVLANVSERNRERIPDPVPVVQADPETLEEVLREVLKDPSAALAAAEAGPDYVRRFHDGEASSNQLLAWLDGRQPPVVPARSIALT
jgi:glycosyltransferase involved in cell wall biosynthesis